MTSLNLMGLLMEGSLHFQELPEIVKIKIGLLTHFIKSYILA